MSSSLNAHFIADPLTQSPVRVAQLPERLRPAKGLLLGVVAAVGFWASAGAVVAVLLR